jgi:hypothetical protein
MSDLSCLLEDGSIDLDKLAEASKHMKAYRVLCEVANALYDGNYQKDSIKLHLKLVPSDWSKDGKDHYGRPYPTGMREIELTSTDVDSLVRNKATVLKDRIEELGFSVK